MFGFTAVCELCRMRNPDGLYAVLKCWNEPLKCPTDCNCLIVGFNCRNPPPGC